MNRSRLPPRQLKRSFTPKERTLRDVPVQVNSWTDEEEHSLILYIIGKGFVKEWPSTKTTKASFWEGAASHTAIGIQYQDK